MPSNSNLWNRVRYSLYSPFYDLLLGRFFSKAREKSIKQLNIQAGEKVLLVGAGTGLDFALLPPGADLTAVDLTPAMVRHMKAKAKKLGLPAEIEEMDGQNLRFPDGSFDKVILHLIIAVIPDPVSCLQEAERVVKHGGHISIFDKFLPYSKKPSFLRKAINRVSRLLFTDINRRIEEIVKKTSLEVLHDFNAGLNGNFRIMLLRKPNPACGK